MAKKTSPRLRASLSSAEDISRRKAPHKSMSGTPQPSGASGRGRGVASSQPGYWLYGTHAVEAALQNPARLVHEILATQDSAALLPRQTPQPVRVVTREQLDTICGRDSVHQGLAMRVDPLLPPYLDDIIAQTNGPVLVLDQVTDPRNIGAILRSSAAFGVAGVIVQDRNTPPETGVMARAASGGLDIVPVLRETNLARTLNTLQKAGFWVIGLDAGEHRLNHDELGERRVALVLGAEGTGLRRLTKETCDEIASIHMPGRMESLNVSNAAAIALYELTRPLGKL